MDPLYEDEVTDVGEDVYDTEHEEKVRVHLTLLKPQGPLPETRADCLPGGSNEARPCGWITCKWYLPRMTWEPKFTCALDVADQGGATLEEVGDLMGITRERIRQIEFVAFRKIKRVDRTGRDKLRVFVDEDPASDGWTY